MATTLDKSDQRVRRMFASIAPRYDLMNHLLSLNVDRYWRRFTVRRLPAAGPVLDVCTGTGDLALAYWNQCQGQYRIVGADFCGPMLDIARQKTKARQICRGIEWVEADTQSLPFETASFELVVVAFGIRNVSSPEQGLLEMRRVCRPGGRIGVLEFSLPTARPLKALYNAYFRHVLPRVGQALSRNDEMAYDYLPSSVQEFPSGERFVDMMCHSGWTDVQSFPLTLGIATLYTGKRPL